MLNLFDISLFEVVTLTTIVEVEGDQGGGGDEEGGSILGR